MTRATHPSTRQSNEAHPIIETCEQDQEGPQGPEAIHWSQCKCHEILHITPKLIILTGHVPANESTALHSHPRDCFAMALCDMPSLTEFTPDAERQYKQNMRTLSIPLGKRMTNLPYADGRSYIHRLRTGPSACSFLAAESPFPTPPDAFRPPRLAVNPVDCFVDEASTHFYTSVRTCVLPGGSVNVSADVCEHEHIARLIVPLNSGFEDLHVSSGPPGLTQACLQKLLPNLVVHVMAIYGFDSGSSALCTDIHNDSGSDRHVVITDLYIAG